MVAFTTVNLGLVAQRTGDLQAGLEYGAEAVDLFRELGDEGGVARALVNWGWNFLDLSDPERAAEVFREALVILAQAGGARTLVPSAQCPASRLLLSPGTRRSAARSCWVLLHHSARSSESI